MLALNRLVARSLVLIALPLAACGRAPTPRDGASDVLVTDVAHTEVKRQSIGNCWIYAQATWLESLLLTQTGTQQNISESYWTWWNFYDQLTGGFLLSEIETGGFWQTGARIVGQHGFVLEGEFIAGEVNAEMSAKQLTALNTINAALKGDGALSTNAKRTPAAVRKALDAAFGSNMAAAELKARKATATIVGKDNFGRPLTLMQALNGPVAQRWSVVNFPRVYGKTGVVTAATQIARKAILARVFKALNDKKPVVMSLMIDFNAVDENSEDAIFRASIAAQKGVGHQGGHMVVLEDYSVNNAPGFGHIGFGDVPDAEKAAAAKGDLELFKVKNSWGKNRLDRPWLHTGYTSFDADYLTKQLPWKNSEDGAADDVSYYTTLTDFVLPPGY